MADLVAEAHDTHHPVGSSLYYEDQKREAKRYADQFRKARVPKYLGYFEKVLERNPRGARYLVGARVTYADLSLFEIVAGLRYAFPTLMKRQAKKYPLVMALHERVAARPKSRPISHRGAACPMIRSASSATMRNWTAE